MTIMCRVIKVDRDATSCQVEGKTFAVDDAMAGKLCPRAQELVESVADRMRLAEAGPGMADVEHVDVACPDHNVVYRLWGHGDRDAGTDE